MTKDPMILSTPDAAKDLFSLFGAVSNGYPNDAVVTAAVNVVINALRQAHPNWSDAEIAFNELFGRSKQILSDHYDSVGRKRGVFPYTQYIQPNLVDARPKFF